MASKARWEVVREGAVATYHTWSRCCQGCFLLGYDQRTRRDYSHRKVWIESLLRFLGDVFAVDIGNFHILCNHLHAIICTRPDVAKEWTAEEVVWRWKRAWNATYRNGEWDYTPGDDEIEEELARGPERVAWIRNGLASLSWMMARWKQPIALLANQEVSARGHFWEQRFGARELVDDNQVFTAMIYNDLQQVKAGVSPSLEESSHSAFQLRFQAWKAAQSLPAIEDFGNSEHGRGLAIDQELVDRLLSASWLAPISDESPLTRMATSAEVQAYHAQRAAAETDQNSATTDSGLVVPAWYAQESAAEVAEEEAVDSLEESAAEDLAESPARQAAVTSDPAQQSEAGGTESCQPVTRSREQRAADRTQRRRTTRIHERLKRRERRRDRPVLAVPWELYQKLAHKLAARWLEQQPAECDDPPQPPGRIPDWMTAGNWTREVRQFANWTLRNLQALPAELVPADLLGSLTARGDPV